MASRTWRRTRPSKSVEADMKRNLAFVRGSVNCTERPERTTEVAQSNNLALRAGVNAPQVAVLEALPKVL